MVSSQSKIIAFVSDDPTGPKGVLMFAIADCFFFFLESQDLFARGNVNYVIKTEMRPTHEAKLFLELWRRIEFLLLLPPVVQDLSESLSPSPSTPKVRL